MRSLIQQFDDSKQGTLAMHAWQKKPDVREKFEKLCEMLWMMPCKSRSLPGRLFTEWEAMVSCCFDYLSVFL
jgi:hypothetical protein